MSILLLENQRVKRKSRDKTDGENAKQNDNAVQQYKQKKQMKFWSNPMQKSHPSSENLKIDT